MKIWPNQYILLVGNPATRKNTAMNIPKHILQEHTSVRFAPHDTGGQRQGIIRALEKAYDNEAEIQAQLDGMDAKAFNALSTEDIGALQLDNRVDPRDRHVLSVCSGEISQFFGQRNATMLDFLIEMWDGGSDYRYETSSQGKNKDIILNDPLMSILGCTTPASLVESLPQQAGSKGFLSRVILVYGAHKYKSIPRPQEPDAELVDAVKTRFTELNYEFSGAMKETEDAAKYTEQVYEEPSAITDSRFIYYNERRFTHFLKLGMLLAAARGSATIVKEDYEEANEILIRTEESMPDALGEFGMSPIAAAKQTILEFMRAAKEPVTTSILAAVMHRDVRMHDLAQCLKDLTSAGQIIQENHPTLGLVYLPKLKEGGIEQLMDLMRDDGAENEEAAE